MKNIDSYEQELINLSKKLYKEENQTETITKIKEIIKKLTETKLFRIKELLKEENGTISINKENLEFILKILNHDEKLYNEINELKKQKQQQDLKNDLEKLETNIINTKEKIKNEINNISCQKKIKKTNIIQKIKNKFKKQKEQSEIYKTLNKIIEIIDESKEQNENKNLKEKYFYKDEINIKETLDILYKKCKIKDISNIEKIKKELETKYNIILSHINTDLQKIKINDTKKDYDKRIIEYIFDKKNNYVTYAIDHLSNQKDNIIISAIKILEQIKDIEENPNKKPITITYFSKQSKTKTFVASNKNKETIKIIQSSHNKNKQKTK